MTKEVTILAGDIGASKTILAVYSDRSGFSSPLKERSYLSAEYSGLVPMLEDFLGDLNLPISSAAFGVAGPVIDQKAQITKLPWSVETAEIKKHVDIPNVFLMNDLVANVYGLDCLESADLVPLNVSAIPLKAPRVMISPGTGLGEAFFVESGKTKEVFDSEGGHCHFAPVGEEQLGLLKFYQSTQQTITVDTFCCGAGFVNIYNYLKQCSSQLVDPAVQEALLSAKHPAAIITENAMLADLNRRCPLCVHTVEIFVEILANEAANMVLKMLARGGVFIGGGIPPKILPYLQKNFISAFARHQSMGHILSEVPVFVACNSRAALYGAALFAMEEAS